MCGRTSLANLPDHLKPFLQRYGVPDVPPWYTPRYNIAPSQGQMVVVENDGDRDVRAMKWGLVPFWAKDPGIGNRMINARCETLAEKPSYREAFAKRRGLIVANSYFEWRTNKKGPKTPFRIHREDDEPFMLAALWERWGHGEQQIETCSVITTSANDTMARIHGRMPVIIAESATDDWLSATSPAAAIQEIISSSANELLAYPVSQHVNAPANDGAMCWERDPTI